MVKYFIRRIKFSDSCHIQPPHTLYKKTRFNVFKEGVLAFQVNQTFVVVE